MTMKTTFTLGASVCQAVLVFLVSQSYAARGVDGNHVDVFDASITPIDVPSTFYTNLHSCPAASYTSLEDMAADAGADANCRALYLLQLFQRNLTASLSRYNGLINGDYDHKFNMYSKAVVQGVSKDVDDFVRGHGNDYFTCVVTEMQFCCSKCGTETNGLAGACTYCFDGGCDQRKLGGGVPHEDRAQMILQDNIYSMNPGYNQHAPLGDGGITVQWKNVTEPCPPDYSQRGTGRSWPQRDTLYWTLRPDKRDQFFADLFAAVGISEGDVAFTDRHNMPGCIPPSESWDECRLTDWDVGIPVPQGYDQSHVLDPKDTVSVAHDRLRTLPGQLNDAMTRMQSGSLGSVSALDLVDALSVPVFMFSEALEQMDVIVNAANEMEREERMVIILAFLSAVCFLIPAAGSVAGSVAALTGIARIASLIGAAGDAAMDIYTIVADPDNAPLAIFDLVLTPLSLLDAGLVRRAAAARRSMTDDEISKLGSNTKARLALVEVCKRAWLGKRDDAFFNENPVSDPF